MSQKLLTAGSGSLGQASASAFTGKPQVATAAGTEGRPFRIFGILGDPDSGKSSLAKAIAAKYPGPIYVVDPIRNWRHLGMGEFPEEAYGNRAAMKDWLDSVTNKGRGPMAPSAVPRMRVGPQGALIIFDDCDTYFQKMGGADGVMWL